MPMALGTWWQGGYAVSFHAQPRFTKDIDTFVKADLDNARAVWVLSVRLRK